MPFDALVQTKPVDELDALGITPVPIQELNRHKDKMIARYGGWWKKYRVLRDTVGKRRFIVEAGDVQVPAIGITPAPRQIGKLAVRVRDAVPEATFTVGWHYRDPYLMVHYGNKSACLGIWQNRFWPVAIAQQS